MICRAVPSSLGARDLVSDWADPLGASDSVVGSDKGMISMASAEEAKRGYIST